jgi:hypothetical protein
MMDRIAQARPRFQARIAGFLSLLIILGGFFGPFAIAPSWKELAGAAGVE